MTSFGCGGENRQRQRQKQIPAGMTSKKSKCNGKDNSKGNNKSNGNGRSVYLFFKARRNEMKTRMRMAAVLRKSPYWLSVRSG